MPAGSLDVALGQFNDLRARMREAKASKRHADIVGICDETVALAVARPELRIVTWMFDRDAAKALAALGRTADAIARIERAAAGCAHHRAREPLSSPDDFLKDLAAMKKLRASWGGAGSK